ncbi:hypothetical protein GGQ73_001365 [Rhizobium skierniewicense]|uniref:Uncharacterized protein n=1 Tax=Rhizobium skierniewicense TaxID=984260 RepID=A0A7W6C451_9HYPH|nr:hypothetical protein [Rhizobium skierniewicense]
MERNAYPLWFRFHRQFKGFMQIQRFACEGIKKFAQILPLKITKILFCAF